MSERPGAGTRRADVPRRSLATRIGMVVLPLSILALIATLVVFGDSIFDGGTESTNPDKGQTASSPIDVEQAEERSEVAETAAAVLDTWSRPGADYPGWWRRLEPMLTPGGRQAYAHTDPAQVPDLQQIELEDVVLHAPGVAATVYFATPEGRFGVDLSRRAAGGDWLANRVVFPGGESMFG